MVCHHSHSDVAFLVFAIFYARKLRNLVDNRGEDIGVVVRLLALHHADEAFESHACIDMLCRKVNKGAVGETVVLHEHEVPNLDNLRIVFIYKVTAVYSLTGFIVTDVDMNLRARSARASLAHLPEVIFL